MVRSFFGRGVLLASALAMNTAAFAQSGQVQVVIDRGLTDDVPYTAIYPDALQSVDDGSSETILTVRHPEALIQCDFFSVAGAPSEWSADAALASLDVAGIESSWAPNFPGFKLSNQSLAQFASGPALFYEGQADSSPMGPPVSVIHAEAVAGGRSYAVECLVDRSVAVDARPMIDFIIANFSTRSDGQCCINPADDRG
jgi:hypothetical protein